MPDTDAARICPGDESALDKLLSRPSARLIETLRRLPGDLAILGIGGKMGFNLGELAVRAAKAVGSRRRVFGVSRFSAPDLADRLRAVGVEPLSCDLLNRRAVARLPRTPLAIFMAGRKFGTDADAALTWAMNTIVPANVAEHYAASRIVAFSTGCVYPLAPLSSRGCTEQDAPEPIGEYAQSCLGRERVFEHYSRARGTPVCLLRLNYAVDLRYGVLHDIARRILAGEPVDLRAGRFNCIWQGDANACALQALALCASPPRPLNVTGPEVASVRAVATRLGRLLDRTPRFTGRAAPCYLSDAGESLRLFGPPRVSLETLIAWQARWLLGGGRSLGKPTHFENTDGRY